MSYQQSRLAFYVGLLTGELYAVSEDPKARKFLEQHGFGENELGLLQIYLRQLGQCFINDRE